jgi:hypothetical protein
MGTGIGTIVGIRQCKRSNLNAVAELARRANRFVVLVGISSEFDAARRRNTLG